MCTLAVEMMLGCKIFYRQEVDPFTAYNHSGLDCKVQLGLLSKLPLETCLVFTIKVHSKEGDGIVCGIGVLKLFD